MPRTPVQPWTEAENQLLFELLPQFGTLWKSYTDFFPTRTYGQIKAKFHNTLCVKEQSPLKELCKSIQTFSHGGNRRNTVEMWNEQSGLVISPLTTPKTFGGSADVSAITLFLEYDACPLEDY